MQKVFVTFEREEDLATLELSAYVLSPDEHTGVFNQLLSVDAENVTVIFHKIDADSIRVEITGTYGNVLQVMMQLRERGWSWEEK